MKILIEESVLRQVLEATEYYLDGRDPTEFGCACEPDTFTTQGSKCGPCAEFDKQAPVKKAITALRSAIKEAENVEPVAEVSDWDINSMDAAVWAKAFADRFTVWSQAHGVESDTFGLMVGWFANAIMAGYDEAVRRHPAPAVPEGWQLVPKEPTDEMLRTLDGCNFQMFNPSNKLIRVDTYKAMLSAAPTPPTNTAKYSDIVSDGGFDPRDMRPGKIEFIPDDSELREAARAVVNVYRNWNKLQPEIDRLRKAL